MAEYVHREHVEAARAVALERLGEAGSAMARRIAKAAPGMTAEQIERALALECEQLASDFEHDILGRLDRLPRVSAGQKRALDRITHAAMRALRPPTGDTRNG